MEVTASADGMLDAWIDFNADGDWEDTGEQIFASEQLSEGNNRLTFDVPATAVATDLTFARFRFSKSGGLSFDGLAPDGEVEDYSISIFRKRIAGDVDGDGEVAFTDFLKLSSNFGRTDATVEDGDLDGNGKVDFADFLILSANFGSTRPQVVAAISSEESQIENVPALNPSDADEVFERFDDELTVDELL